ncbi:hypothetical protein ACLB2K_072867 [Fragaria x ananassa]
MTRTWKPETSSSDKKPTAANTGMRLIVPLQGVLYLKRHRLDQEPHSPSLSSSNLAELHRSSSRSSLSGRGSISRVWVSSQADPIAKPNESPYYIELDRARRRTNCGALLQFIFEYGERLGLGFGSEGESIGG